MMRESVHAAQPSIEAELEELAYSAYLLTLDPALALSVVMTALDGSLENLSADFNLERKIVNMSLRQLQRKSGMACDNECSFDDAILYANSGVADPRRFPSLEEGVSTNPILSLDSGPRVAFVLHHVLGYNTGESALLMGTDEKGFRTQLRGAYVQLAFGQLRQGTHVN